MFPDQDAWPRGDCRCKCDRTGYSHRHGDALPQKLYVYVDALGQDTLGALFVATVLTAYHHERVRQSLQRLERALGKGLRTWIKATPRHRLTYLAATVQLPALHRRRTAAHFTNTTTYLPCVLTAICPHDCGGKAQNSFPSGSAMIVHRTRSSASRISPRIRAPSR